VSNTALPEHVPEAAEPYSDERGPMSDHKTPCEVVRQLTHDLPGGQFSAQVNHFIDELELVFDRLWRFFERVAPRAFWFVLDIVGAYAILRRMFEW
jgi:hypothetical protein